MVHGIIGVIFVSTCLVIAVIMMVRKKRPKIKKKKISEFEARKKL